MMILNKDALRQALAEKREAELIEDVFDNFGIKDHRDSFVITTTAHAAMSLIMSYAAIAAQATGICERTLSLLIERGSRFVNLFKLVAMATNALQIKDFDPYLVPEQVVQALEKGEYSEEAGFGIEELDTPNFRALVGHLIDELNNSDKWHKRGLDRGFTYHFLKRLEQEMTPALLVAIMNASLADADMSDKEFEMRQAVHLINAVFYCDDPDVVYGLFGGQQAVHPKDVGHEGGGDDKAPCEDGGDDEKGCAVCFLYDRCCPFYDRCPHGKPKHNPEAEP